MFFSVFSDRRRDADKLGSRNEKPTIIAHANHRRKAAGKRRIVDNPVAPARRLCAFKDAKDHHHADNNKDDDGGHFDQREPVFRFTKAFFLPRSSSAGT